MKHKKIMVLLLALLLLTALCCTSAFAANGDVASAVEETWKEAAKQIKSVVETVVFPCAGYDPRHRILCETWWRVL